MEKFCGGGLTLVLFTVLTLVIGVKVLRLLHDIYAKTAKLFQCGTIPVYGI